MYRCSFRGSLTAVSFRCIFNSYLMGYCTVQMVECHCVLLECATLTFVFKEIQAKF